MSVQVQLRRDTLANVLANHGAAGEVFISTDTKEIFVQDGATNGDFKASGTRALFGSLAQPALAESAGAGGETLGTGVTTYTSTLQLPAGYKFIMGAGWLVKTTIIGITTIDFGVTGAATLFAAIQSPSLTAGSTVIYGQNQVRFDSAPVSLLLTSHAGTNFTAGAVRFVVHYISSKPANGIKGAARATCFPGKRVGVANMTTVNMIPPSDGQHNSISVNGRTYASTPGISIPVPDFDAAVLQANGWAIQPTVPATNSTISTTTGGVAPAYYFQGIVNPPAPSTAIVDGILAEANYALGAPAISGAGHLIGAGCFY